MECKDLQVVDEKKHKVIGVQQKVEEERGWLTHRQVVTNTVVVQPHEPERSDAEKSFLQSIIQNHLVLLLILVVGLLILAIILALQRGRSDTTTPY